MSLSCSKTSPASVREIPPRFDWSCSTEPAPTIAVDTPGVPSNQASVTSAGLASFAAEQFVRFELLVLSGDPLLHLARRTAGRDGLQSSGKQPGVHLAVSDRADASWAVRPPVRSRRCAWPGGTETALRSARGSALPWRRT